MENLIFRIKHIYLQPHQPNMYIYEYTYRMFNKNCIFVNSLQPIPCMEIELLILAKDLSTHHSYWLVIFCTTNSSPVLLAREKPQNFKNSKKKNSPPPYTMFLNTLKYLFIFVIAFSLFGTTAAAAAGGAPGGKVDVD